MRLSGRGLHGLLLPLHRVRLAQVRGGVPLRQEVALRAGGGGRWRDHPQQVCSLAGSDSLAVKMLRDGTSGASGNHNHSLNSVWFPIQDCDAV